MKAQEEKVILTNMTMVDSIVFGFGVCIGFQGALALYGAVAILLTKLFAGF